MTEQPSEPTSPPARTDHSWLVLAVSIAFVVAVVAGFSVLMRDSLTPDPSKAFDLKFTDDFDRRSNSGGLGVTPSGQRWTSIRGLWNVDAGRAVVAFPDKELSLATVGNLQNGAVMATISGKYRCGLVARFIDAQNYVELVRVPGFGVWNLVEVRNGKETVLGKLTDVESAVITVKLETGARVLNAYIGPTLLSVVAPAPETVGAVGFSAHTADSRGCVWSDLWAFSGR